MLKRRLFNYNQFPLQLKISLPFILVSLGLWIIGTVVLGEYFSATLERRQRAQAIDLASLVERDLEQKLHNLRRDARLLASEPTIIQHVSEQDRRALQQKLLPLKSILDADAIQILGSDRQMLLDTRKAVLRDVQLEQETLLNLLLTGSDISTVVDSNNSGSPALVGTAPIKSDQGIVGGVILGIALSDDLLTQINEGVEEQMVLLSDRRVVSSTFSPTPETLQWIESNIHTTSADRRQNKEFLAQIFTLEGIDDEHFEVALLISRKPLQQAVQAMWLTIFLVSGLGSLLIALGGHWIARKIAQPVQVITAIAQRVVTDQNFSLQASVDTEDEIGALARALNQLIQWVGQYTYDLEVASQTLEAKVEVRTAELSNALKELKEAQAQLTQTEKMSSLGQMVAGIAHEINNPINFIQGNIGPLKDYLQDLRDLIETYQNEYPQPTVAILDKHEEIDLEFVLDDSAKLMTSITVGAQRVRDIVVTLRNYSRLDEAAIKDVDIHDGIDGTLLILNHRIKQGVDVTKDYGSLPLVRCSPAQLNQVFTNIIANALDAMFDHDCDPKQLAIATRTLPAEKIQIRIRDSGPGMPPEVQSKIFNPFFTTKAIGKGTGLGLGICFKIIQQHQGHIDVESAPGEGTEFIITLPTEAMSGEG